MPTLDVGVGGGGGEGVREEVGEVSPTFHALAKVRGGHRPLVLSSALIGFFMLSLRAGWGSEGEGGGGVDSGPRLRAATRMGTCEAAAGHARAD